MASGAGEGRSRYNGLRVTMICVPNSDRGFLNVTRKTWRDGWDTWAAIAPLQRKEFIRPRNDLEALEIMYEALGELLDAERAKL